MIHFAAIFLLLSTALALAGDRVIVAFTGDSSRRSERVVVETIGDSYSCGPLVLDWKTGEAYDPWCRRCTRGFDEYKKQCCMHDTYLDPHCPAENAKYEGSFPTEKTCCEVCTEITPEHPTGCWWRCDDDPWMCGGHGTGKPDDGKVEVSITGSNDGFPGVITNCGVGGETVPKKVEASTSPLQRCPPDCGELTHLVGDSTILRRPTLGSYDICMNAATFWCRSPRQRKIQKHVGMGLAKCVAINVHQCRDCALVMQLMPRRLDPDYGDCREWLTGSNFKSRNTAWMNRITVYNIHGEKLEW